MLLFSLSLVQLLPNLTLPLTLSLEQEQIKFEILFEDSSILREPDKPRG